MTVKRKLAVVFMVIASLTLTSCYNYPKEEKEKSKKLVSQHKSSFVKQAKVQYGKKAKVSAIQAEKEYISNQLWPTFDVITGKNLIGKITSNDEEFNSMYIVKDKKIISDKNKMNIIDSMLDTINETRLKDIVEIDILDSEGKKFMMEDDILTHQDLFNSDISIQLRIVTRDSLYKYEPEDFVSIFNEMKQYPRAFTSIDIVEVEDADKANKLASRTVFNYYDDILLHVDEDYSRNISKEVIDYTIKSAIKLTSKSDSYELNYVDLNGNIINKKLQ